MTHLDVCTHIANPEDLDILTRPLFNVNMRLLKTSPSYFNVVKAAADYIWDMAHTTREGYKTPHGFSGANAGIPFNIIAVKGMSAAMLNPRVIKGTGARTSMANCGSLTLAEPIEILRFAHVEVEYWDLEGDRHLVEGFIPTIQHEIDHNRGILITNRKVQP